MNPDKTSPEYQAHIGRIELERAADAGRREALHRKALARRRKAKRGGKR